MPNLVSSGSVYIYGARWDRTLDYREDLRDSMTRLESEDTARIG